MNVLVLPDHESVSRHTADLLCAATAWKPTAQLCVASGTTPTRAYELVGERVRAGEASFARARLVQLAEWCGIAADDPIARDRYLAERVLGPFGIARDRYVGFHGDSADHDAECNRVRAHLAGSGGIDLCLLGLGLNGHIALNEPGDYLAPAAHIADLTAATRAHARSEQQADVPEQGFTLGVGELLGAREVLLVATGAAKAPAVRRLMEGEIATGFPASLLWTHPRALAVFDRAAYVEVARKSLFGA